MLEMLGNVLTSVLSLKRRMRSLFGLLMSSLRYAPLT